MNLNIGPGPRWPKDKYPDWKTLDYDSNRADYLFDLNKGEKLPFADNSVGAIYASHVFEHVSIFASSILFKECYRILEYNGWLRVIVPNPRASMKHYLKENNDFILFKERRHLKGNEDLTLFECLKLDFLSKSEQKPGELAHQNAWDDESLMRDFKRGGFDKVYLSEFRKSKTNLFDFEGIIPGTANQPYRSVYVEGQK